MKNLSCMDYDRAKRLQNERENYVKSNATYKHL